MSINYNMFISLILGSFLFLAGYKLSSIVNRNSQRLMFTVLFLFLSIPGLSFVIYYLHLIKEPIWYVEFRSINNIEVIVSFFGLFFGFTASIIRKFIKFGGKAINLCLFIVCLGMIFIPFCKPVLLPLKESGFKDSWKDGVCMQSKSSTCGPSSFATIFSYYGINKSEREIAQAAFSCGSGTENWYLIRYARKNDLKIECMYKETLAEVPVPSVIGTRIGGGAGHFITVLGKDKDKFIIGDSLRGRLLLSQEEFNQWYDFEGFVMNVKLNSSSLG